MGYDLEAWRIFVGLYQLGIVVLYILRHFELYLRNILSVGIHNLSVKQRGHMQYDIVVSAVVVVTMLIPVARLVVNLHITYPQIAIDADLGIEKVRAGIVIMQTWVYHFDKSTVTGSKFFQWKKLMFPDVVN